MRVRELLDVVADSREVFIKPNGKRTYYQGWSDDVPECLMDAVVVEISAKPYKAEEESNLKYDWKLGIWIENIKEMDVITDVNAELHTWSGEEIDATYGHFKLHESELMADYENFKEDRKHKRFEKFYSSSDRAIAALAAGKKVYEQDSFASGLLMPDDEVLEK